ncbi:MOSC domain-containing protein [Endozoicomonas ascidiicola]|uniref:MOSC domain-containing protein n=1 Tax=Endozoicomonas ascidiicola TaxID=1698521 RepID=UPI00082C19BA|nr:MOSC domain-containing protein [Endozoicomonas ascidiicola]
MEVTQLAIYPVKSAQPINLSSAKVTLRGFEHDRRWLLVDENGRFLTQRKHHKMALIHISVEADGLQASAQGAGKLHIPTPTTDAAHKPVTVWKDNCDALDAGDQPAEWFSRLLGLRCRLVYQPDEAIRVTDPQFSNPGDHTSFADGFPFLLTNEASLQDLNQRLEQPMTMNRFRPNIVVNGKTPFDEDNWNTLKIGDITFRATKPCSRCIMTTINPETAERDGTEPLTTLSKYRRTDMGVIFGQNLIPDGEGVIHIGDKVSILS